MCPKHFPHTITPPPPAWTVETRQDGSILSSLRQILTLPSECFSRKRDSSDQATFFQSSIVQFCWACVNCSLHFLLLADRSGTRCGLLLLAHLLQGLTHSSSSSNYFICLQWGNSLCNRQYSTNHTQSHTHNTEIAYLACRDGYR